MTDRDILLWIITNVLTDSQLDFPCPALDGKTMRQWFRDEWNKKQAQGSTR